MGIDAPAYSASTIHKQNRKHHPDRSWRVVAKATDSLIKLRISPEMLNRLQEHAEYNGRSTNNEILVIIREALINSI